MLYSPMAFKAKTAFLFGLLISSTTFVSADNPVGAPIVDEGFRVETKRFAKVPDSNGTAAKIICMVPNGDALYVCTFNHIYKVDANRHVSLYLDVESATATATNRTLSTRNEAHGGVRSIAFHPEFDSKGLLYISAMESRPSNPQDFHYISDAATPISADSVLLEFKVDPSSGLPRPSSYRLVFRVGMPVFDHPIKQIAFHGKFLYIAHGDGSVQSAVAGGGQNNDALGKVLRIDPRERRGLPYTVPRGNPFYGSSTMKEEVWALGFRNPHHISFGDDGTLYSADAGRANVEEVNIVLKGKNYGWSEREGTFVHIGGELINGVRPLPSDDPTYGFEYPAAQFGHEGTAGDGFTGQAIAGGCPVENGSAMSGNYYYADFARSGRFFYSVISEMKSTRRRGNPRRLTQANTKIASIAFDHDDDRSTDPVMFADLGETLRSEPGLESSRRVDIRFGRGSNGELYWSSKQNGQIYLFTSSLP